MVEEICARLLEELKRQNLTYGEETFLELHVERILEAKEEMNPIIEQIVEMEWEMFQNVRNTGGRVACQDDFETFDVMRKSQFLIWGSASFGELLAGSSRGKSAGKKSGDGKVCLYDGVYSSKRIRSDCHGTSEDFRRKTGYG